MSPSKDLSIISGSAVATSTDAEIVAFDYAGFTAEERKAAKRDEKQIKGLHQTGKAAAMAIGQVLDRAKKRLEHGKFEAWVEAAFGHMFSLRTALRYRKEAVALLEAPTIKSDKLSDLPKTETKSQTKLDRSAVRAAAAEAAVEVLNRVLSDDDLQLFMSSYREAGPSAFSKALDSHAS